MRRRRASSGADCRRRPPHFRKLLARWVRMRSILIAMSRKLTVAVVSDIHYASAAEQARGKDYELAHIRNPLLRLALKGHRHFLWLRDPLHQNHLLDVFLQKRSE